MSSALTTVYGALLAMSSLAALFFLRYWYLSRDRFFLWFSAAFVMFAVNWALVGFEVGVSEHATPIYAVRLVGFLLILAGILMKNRR